MTVREREQSDINSDRPPKRSKTGDSRAGSPTTASGFGRDSGSSAQVDSPLPPSHVLLGIPPSSSDGFVFRIEERDVGISEYVGRNVPKVDGIIKQR
jgi:tRNA pseudouridine13 synthase